MAQETQQMKLAGDSAEKRGKIESAEWFSIEGVPMTRITCAASELIPTREYANVTIGPVQVQRFVPADADLASEISATQSLCESAVAEERQTVHALMRANAAARS